MRADFHVSPETSQRDHWDQEGSLNLLYSYHAAASGFKAIQYRIRSGSILFWGTRSRFHAQQRKAGYQHNYDQGRRVLAQPAEGVFQPVQDLFHNATPPSLGFYRRTPGRTLAARLDLLAGSPFR